MGERECSIQRRHQKVLEEAPSPFISPETRKAMGEQAVALAKAVEYRSAGTVEFIVGADQDFYFLEMNTRLQVEHPVTEMVYGLDLVEWMIRVAAGESLTLQQSDITPKGWAMEARLYAEDPERDFLPSIGQLLRYREPEGEGVRVDSGVEEGGAISMFYDPMIAKLISFADTREEAITRLEAALDDYEIKGIQSNRQFLSAVLENEHYRKGDITTGFIASEFADGFQPSIPSGDVYNSLITMALSAVWEAEARHHHGEPENHYVITDQAGTVTEAQIGFGAEGELGVVIADACYVISDIAEDGANHLIINDAPFAAQMQRDNHHVTLTKGSHRVHFTLYPARAAGYLSHMPVVDENAGADEVIAPMPGLLTSLLVKAGDEVQKGQNVAIIEAMKMENMLQAEASGTVKSVHAKEGDNLNVEDLILTLDLADEAS